jgi:hypothetical protein
MNGTARAVSTSRAEKDRGQDSHMARANRLRIDGGVFHLTHRCHNQAFLLKFACDRDAYRVTTSNEITTKGSDFSSEAREGRCDHDGKWGEDQGEFSPSIIELFSFAFLVYLLARIQSL